MLSNNKNQQPTNTTTQQIQQPTNLFYLACTRFSNKTYEENMNYRLNHGEVVLYGPSFKISEKYPINAPIYVIEMNNEKNKIEGIGLIKNILVVNKRHKIYENGEYNRYIYRGKHWLSREQLGEEISEILDTVLFKGKSHMKRRTGITVLGEKIFKNWNHELEVIKGKIRTEFSRMEMSRVDLDSSLSGSNIGEIIKNKDKGEGKNSNRDDNKG